MENLKVGQSSRVFEVINNPYLGETPKFTIEKEGKFKGNVFGTDLFVGSEWDHFAISGCRKINAICVGKITITKVKSPKERKDFKLKYS